MLTERNLRGSNDDIRSRFALIVSLPSRLSVVGVYFCLVECLQ